MLDQALDAEAMLVSSSRNPGKSAHGLHAQFVAVLFGELVGQPRFAGRFPYWHEELLRLLDKMLSLPRRSWQLQNLSISDLCSLIEDIPVR